MTISTNKYLLLIVYDIDYIYKYSIVIVWIWIETSNISLRLSFDFPKFFMLPYDGPLRYRLDIFRVRSTSSGMKSNVPKNAQPNLATCRLGRFRGRDTPIAGWF